MAIAMYATRVNLQPADRGHVRFSTNPENVFPYKVITHILICERFCTFPS